MISLERGRGAARARLHGWGAALAVLGALCGPGRALADPAATTAATAPAAEEPRAAVQTLWDLDPYYSSVDLQIPLTDAPVPAVGRLPEPQVYRRLFEDSLRPRILLLEGSVYPLPVLGSWLKRNRPGFYNDFNVGGAGNFNLMQAATAGFQEPWAVSAFTGSTVRFTSTDNNSEGNRGYMGYLASFGTRHIYNNVMVDDNWWELEWKLKGERNVADEKLSWSFRVGVKNHGSPFIRDLAYIGLRRTNLDYRGTLLSFLDNSDLELLTECDLMTGRFLYQEITVGRRFPLPGRHLAFGLDLGLIYQSPAAYTGPLAALHGNLVTTVLRPNLEF